MAKDKKVKASSEASKAKADTVKTGRVAKPVEKAASKETAKKAAKVVEKESKKSKKVRAPTPSSDDESDEDGNTSESSDSSAADSSDEEMTDAKPAANGSAKAAAAAESDSDSDDPDDSEDDEGGLQVPKVNGTANGQDAAAGATSDSDSSDDDEEADSSDDEEEEKAPAAKEVSKKRKADDAADNSSKKTKFMVEGEEKEAVANLFVGQLSWNVDDDWLSRHFEEGGHGTIMSARVITDRDSGRSKGFGYVEYSSAAEAGKALEALQGSELDGRNIRVDFSTPRADKGTPQQKSNDRAKKFGDAPKEPSSTLWVGNLPFDVEQHALSEYFSEHGSVSGVRLPTDRETGELKGFGYVEMSSIDEATAAFEALQGADFNGRPMRLDYSGPRPERQDSFGGGRGGGGRGGFSRGGRGGGRGRGNDRGGRGGRGGRGNFTTNRGGFGDFSGQKKTF